MPKGDSQGFSKPKINPQIPTVLPQNTFPHADSPDDGLGQCGDKVKKGDRLVDSAVDIQEGRTKRIGQRGQDRRRSPPDVCKGREQINSVTTQGSPWTGDEEGLAREMRGPFSMCRSVEVMFEKPLETWKGGNDLSRSFQKKRKPLPSDDKKQSPRDSVKDGIEEDGDGGGRGGGGVDGRR